VFFKPETVNVVRSAIASAIKKRGLTPHEADKGTVSVVDPEEWVDGHDDPRYGGF